jgi:hypothetical protein
MRTPEEVAEYLQAQYWTENFLNEFKKKSRPGKQHLLAGATGALAIKAAFNWSKTEQGEAYWKEADKSFQKWFNG